MAPTVSVRLSMRRFEHPFALWECVGALLASCSIPPKPTPEPPRSVRASSGPLSPSDPTGPAAPEIAWPLTEDGVASETVGTWSLVQALPYQYGTIRGEGRGQVPQLLILPGQYGGFELIRDSTRRFLPGEPQAWMQGAAGGALRSAMFVSDGRGVGFVDALSLGPDDAPSFEVAGYGPTASRVVRPRRRCCWAWPPTSTRTTPKWFTACPNSCARTMASRRAKSTHGCSPR